MRVIAIAVLLGLAVPSVSLAQPASRAAALERLSACRAQTDPAARLSCYDAAASALDEAERSGDVVVMDRAQVRETRRSLFGFSVPTIPLFTGGEQSQEDIIDNVSFTISRVRRVGPDVYLFTMSDGTVWRQLDQWRGAAPRSGDTAVIRRASLGSFLMRVENYAAIRVRREE